MPHSTQLTEEDKAVCRAIAKLYRERKVLQGMTQKELGEQIGMSDKAISAIVNERMKVSVNTARKFAAVFDVPLPQLVPWTAEIVSSNDDLVTVIDQYRQLNSEQKRVIRLLIKALLQ